LRHKLDLGSALVALGALLLAVALFLDWYEPGLSAWDAFEVVDWLLAGLVVITLVGLALGPGADLRRWVPVLAGAALFLVVAQVIDPPPAAAEASRETGAWLALAAGLLMASGIAMSLASISVTVDVRERERRRRVAAVDRREAAAAAAPEPAPPPPPAPPRARAPPPAASDPERTQPLSPVERGEP
jgi:hypothetical protein